MNLNKANLFALCIKIINGFCDSVANRAHSDDDMLCIRCAVVIKGLVIGADFLVYLIHIHNGGFNSIVIILIASLSVLEEDIRVFRRAAKRGVLRIKCTLTEALNIIHINHVFKIFVIPNFNLLDFVRSAEAVKEMKERNRRFKG